MEPVLLLSWLMLYSGMDKSNPLAANLIWHAKDPTLP